MLRSIRRLAITAVSVLLLVAGLQVAAEAKAVPRVSGLAVKGQNSCAATMRVQWKGVSGATYEVRWASAKSSLAAATPLSVRRHAMTAGPLAGGKTFFQVRAVRQGRAGAWSAVRAGRFSGQRATRQRLAQPGLSGQGVPGGAQFTWRCTPGASRYRVAWSAVPFGKWPTTPSYVSGWLSKSARSSTFVVPAVPQPGDHMLGVAYANPVFGQLAARNARGTVRHSTGWVPVFPAAPDPGPGDAIRFGTYNVLGGPTGGGRITAIAANIRDHGLGIVALQEANAQTAAAVASALGSDWTYVDYQRQYPKLPPQQILYRSGSYQLAGGASGYGTFDVSNPVDPATPITTPWAWFLPAHPSAGSQPVLVTSVHEIDNTNRSVMDRKRDSGIFAQQVMGAVNRINPGGLPVIVAGDLNYLREPYGDVPGYVEAPPTLVRGGYYDAMAALSKTNIAYSTFNGGNGTTAPGQAPVQSGVAGRSDYIMLKGFRGSNAYVNVANWSLNGLVPSDHNLVYADVTVPFK